MGRQAKEDDEIRGYHIPAKSLVTFSQYVTHRHPAFWENPEAFDPERFTPARAAGRPHFALLEAQLLLATLAQRYRPRPVPGHPIVPEPGITLRPRYGMPMTLHAGAAGA